LAKTKTRTKRRARTPARPVQHPKAKASKPARRYGWLIWGALVALAAGGAFLLAKNQAEGPDEAVAPPATGLPNTPDYHSLLVAPTDPSRILLGTHVGLYQSSDGGRSWRFARLEGRDAMNLAPAGGSTVWTAGHEVLARSSDGGLTWADVRPTGLPSLDLHGFAVDPRDPKQLLAAVAGQGLYRSADGGRSFKVVSQDVGGDVMALAIAPDGRILAGDMRRGLLVSVDEGKTWKATLAEGVMGLAINPGDPERVVATGRGIFLSTDGGETWTRVRPVSPGAGPAAWAPSDPQTGYAVGFDRILYKTADAGASWQPVS
jgi:photosystem II stability/assembly factor-like uncharacterized protein